MDSLLSEPPAKPYVNLYTDTYFHFSWVGSYGGNFGSCGSFMLTFNFLRNWQAVLQSGCSVLQQWMRVRISPCCYQHLMLPVFLRIAIIVGM